METKTTYLPEESYYRVSRADYYFYGVGTGIVTCLLWTIYHPLVAISFLMVSILIAVWMLTLKKSEVKHG